MGRRLRALPRARRLEACWRHWAGTGAGWPYSARGARARARAHTRMHSPASGQAGGACERASVCLWEAQQPGQAGEGARALAVALREAHAAGGSAVWTARSHMWVVTEPVHTHTRARGQAMTQTYIRARAVRAYKTRARPLTRARTRTHTHTRTLVCPLIHRAWQTRARAHRPRSHTVGPGAEPERIRMRLCA